MPSFKQPLYSLKRTSKLASKLALLTALMLPTAVLAGTSIGVGGSTLGFQFTLAHSLSDTLTIKLAHSLASYDSDGETDGVDYEYDLDFSSTAVLLDWHAFNSGFRFTAGAVVNDNEISATSKVSGLTIEVGNTVFTNEQVGRLEGDIGFDSLAPYVGIGWGRAVAEGFAFSFDLGLMIQGEPEVELRSVGGSQSNNAILINEVEREEQELQDDVDDFDMYPVVSLGVSYSF